MNSFALTYCIAETAVSLCHERVDRGLIDMDTNLIRHTLSPAVLIVPEFPNIVLKRHWQD